MLENSRNLRDQEDGGEYAQEDYEGLPEDGVFRFLSFELIGLILEEFCEEGKPNDAESLAKRSIPVHNVKVSMTWS